MAEDVYRVQLLFTNGSRRFRYRKQPKEFVHN